MAILVLVFSVCAIVYSTAGNPSFVKGVADSSGLYDNFVESTLEYVATQTLTEDEILEAETDSGEPPTKDEGEGDGISDERAAILPDLTPTFQRVLTPERLRSTVETVFDGLTGWLKGDTEDIEFTIDTAEIRGDLTVALADYMEQRVADLPPPPRGASMNDYDPLTAEYAPRDPLSREQLELIAADLAVEMPFMDKDVTTGADLPDDLTDNDTLQTAQKAFWWGRVGVIVFACLLVAGSALALAFSHDRRRVLRRLGHVVVPSAVLLLVGGAVLALFVANLDAFGGEETSAAREMFDQAITLPLWDSLFTGVGSVVLGFGAAWAVVALVCYVLGYVLKRRQRDAVPPTPATGVPSDGAAPHSPQSSAGPPADPSSDPTSPQDNIS